MFRLKSNLVSIFISFLYGALICEFIIIIYLIIEEFISVSIPTSWHTYCVVLIGTLYIIFLVILCKYNELHRKVVYSFKKILKSKRCDIYFSFFVGVLCSLWFKGYGIKAINISFVAKPAVCHFIIISPLFILLGQIINYKLKNKIKTIDVESKFISDNEITFSKDDLLDSGKSVEDFATNVYDNKSSNNLVFGVDSPWGIGKTSFINLCKEYWHKNYRDNVIVYTFNPTHFEGDSDIFNKFIDGFIKEIKGHIFSPELKPMIIEYAKSIKTSMSISGLYSLNVAIPEGESNEDLLKNIENVLIESNKKIVIIIDDFDRLDKGKLNSTLNIIKKAFSLKSITYILCYDTNNLISLCKKNGEYDTLEFFEKYVNVKYTLFNNSKELFKKFVYGQDSFFKIEESENIDGTIISGIINIFESESYKDYIPYIGDLRKIKRLLNTIVVLGLEKADLRNYDFDELDLLNLLLIYLNYPNVFRKIYNEETQLSRGFFSVVQKYDKGFPDSNNNGGTTLWRHTEYRNSTYYSEYIENAPQNVRFLLEQIFNEDKTKNDSEKEKRIRACYNGSPFRKGNTNLERYLKLITENTFPKMQQQYKYYENLALEILHGKSINDVLWIDDFSCEEEERNHYELLKMTIRYDKFELNKQIENKNNIFKYLLGNVNKYTHIQCKGDGYGYRYRVLILIAEIIDLYDYSKESHDSEEKESEISLLIFGEDSKTQSGVLHTLSNNIYMELGLYDLITFSHICASSDTGFNTLLTALTDYSNVNGMKFNNSHMFPDYIKQYFYENYIEQDKDLFEEIDSLSLKNIAGEWSKALIEYDNIERYIEQEKNRMKIYISFQLLHLFLDGVESKTDDWKVEMQNYLFTVCFGGTKQESFLDYLLMNFEHNSIGGWIFDVEKINQRLGKDNVKNYWNNNRNEILNDKYLYKDKKVSTSNYYCTYMEDLPVVYKKLDELINTDA